jgi:hypothetical protein
LFILSCWNSCFFFFLLEKKVVVLSVANKSLKSVKIYLMKHKVTFTFVYKYTKYNSWPKDTGFGMQNIPTFLCTITYIKLLLLFMQ